MNQSRMLTDFANNGRFDCFLLAGRYSLLDQTALADLLPVAERKGIGIIVGGVYNSGILADPHNAPKFDYQDADADLVARAKALDAACRRFHVPLKAAAIQFPIGHSAVPAILTGARNRAEIDENVAMFSLDIPRELWAALVEEALIPEDVPLPAQDRS